MDSNIIILYDKINTYELFSAIIDTIYVPVTNYLTFAAHIDLWSYTLLKSLSLSDNWALRNKLQGNFNRNSTIFIQENAFENVVCEIVVILYRPQCV